MDITKDLEIIKTRTIFLEEGHKSSELVLVDNSGAGDMYFTLSLKYVDKAKSETHLTIIDDFHASLVIETTPTAITSLSQPWRVGTYANQKELLISFIVEPCNANKLHRITITFYTNKK